MLQVGYDRKVKGIRQTVKEIVVQLSFCCRREHPLSWAIEVRMRETARSLSLADLSNLIPFILLPGFPTSQKGMGEGWEPPSRCLCAVSPEPFSK